MNSQINKRGAQAPLLGSKIRLIIEKLIIGGAGIARHEGFVYFIPQTAPQDEIIAEVTLVKKSFAEGRVVEILKPGPGRREAPCRFALNCGGCNWQHITEDVQQSQKSLLVHETLKKFNPDIAFEYLPLKPSPKSLRYRNRIQPKFYNDKFGFFARNTHEIVDIDDCLITEEELINKFSEVRDWAQKRHIKGLQKLEMYISEDGTVKYNSLSEESDGIGFSQVNRFQNADLIQTALEWAGNGPFTNIFDLYAGSGNFTFPLAQKYNSSQIIGVELNPKLVERAKSNIKSPQIQFHTSDVERFITHANIGKTDLVLLDPPRAGASELIMKTLAKAKPQKIIYVSCHPVSLARDLQWLFSWANKYGSKVSLNRVQAFEMFPQTDHVETIAELRVDS